MTAASHSNPRVRRNGAQPRAGWRAVLLAALLAFSWQSFLTQTHRHYDPARASAAAATQQSGRELPSDTPANCPICSEIAHAGPALLPTPVQIVAPAPVVFHAAAAQPLGLALVQRSHAWRSRAPPHQLQG